jgi:hypothetical protein
MVDVLKCVWKVLQNQTEIERALSRMTVATVSTDRALRLQASRSWHEAYTNYGDELTHPTLARGGGGGRSRWQGRGCSTASRSVGSWHAGARRTCQEEIVCRGAGRRWGGGEAGRVMQEGSWVELPLAEANPELKRQLLSGRTTGGEKGRRST